MKAKFIWQLLTRKSIWLFILAGVCLWTAPRWIEVIGWENLPTQTKILRQRIGEQIANLIGENRLMNQQIQESIAQLENEIRQLHWIEAESSIAAEIVNRQLTELEAQYQANQADLLAMASQLETNQPGQSVLLTSGAEIPAAAIEEVANQMMEDATTLAEQIQLYRQIGQVYQASALKARSTWKTAEQNIETMQAYYLFYEATQVDGGSGQAEENQPNGQAQGIVEALQAQIMRNQRITELRQELESSDSTQFSSRADTILDSSRQKNHSNPEVDFSQSTDYPPLPSAGYPAPLGYPVPRQ